MRATPVLAICVQAMCVPAGAAAIWIGSAPRTRGFGLRTSADGAAWQLAIHGTINTDGHAPLGIVLRSATKVSALFRGM